MSSAYMHSLAELPLTLMRLQEVINSHVFKRVSLLHDVVRNGIMDFLVGGDADSGKKLFDADFYN